MVARTTDWYSMYLIGPVCSASYTQSSEAALSLKGCSIACQPKVATIGMLFRARFVPPFYILMSGRPNSPDYTICLGWGAGFD